MNITLTGNKITQDTKFLAFEKNNNVDVINITVDADEEWTYKLDVKYPDKCCSGEQLYNIINLTRNGNVCTAVLTKDMLPFTGKYIMQLRAINDDKVQHSDTFDAWVKYSIEPSETYNPVPSEFYQIENNITEMNNNPPYPSADGYWMIWDVTSHAYKKSDIRVTGGNVQSDWSQNDAQAADFVKNRPGAYVTDPVETEIYNGILPEIANIQMDYVPNIGDVVTVKVGTESIDCTAGDYRGLIYFATVPIEDIVGGTATNYVLCAYQESQWVAQTAGTYTGQNAVFEAAIRQIVKIPEKFLELENVKDVYWINFAYDSKSKMYFSHKLDGTYAEYEDIKAAIDNGKLVAAIGEVFGESVNVGFVTEYWKYVSGLTASFYEASDPDTYSVLMRLAYFVCRSGHIWKKVNSSIELAYGKPMPSTLEGEQGTKDSVARSDHSHPDRTSIQFLGKLIDGDEKTVACGNVSPDTPFVVSGLDIPIGAEITLGFDDFTPDTPITMTWGGTADAYFNNMGKSWKVSLAYNACTDAYTVTTTRALTNLTLAYKAVPAQTKDYQKYVLAPYTVAPHLLLASPNGLHKLTVDDNGNLLVDGNKVGVFTANNEKVTTLDML